MSNAKCSMLSFDFSVNVVSLVHNLLFVLPICMSICNDSIYELCVYQLSMY